MESKKMNKNFNSVIWSVIYVLPLMVLFITYIGYLLVYRETGSADVVISDHTIIEASFIHVNNIFTQFNWSFIKDTLSSLFVNLGFEIVGNTSQFVIIFFTWFIQLAFIHILVDVILFIPRFFHKVLERWS